MKSVEKGWLGAREVDRVVFDPESVSVAQMEAWLKEAGTYLDTVQEGEKPSEGEGAEDGAP